MSGLEGAGEPRLLLIMGTDRPDQLRISATRFQLTGATDIYKLLGNTPYHRLQMTPNYFRQAKRPELAGYQCLLNLITEPEQNSKVLENLRKLLRGLPGKVVNKPEAITRTTRDQVSRRLAGISGLHVPRAIRIKAANAAVATRTIERANLSFPVIVRQAGTHTGKIVGLFDSPEGAGAALGHGGEHIVTEFVDFRSADGVYRKYRVFFIGKQIIFRHMIVAESWNVHAKDRKAFMAGRPDLIGEEKGMFARVDGAFPDFVHPVLQAVRDRMGLDFFGMDFGLTEDGKVLLFEANATMNFFPPDNDPTFGYWELARPPARDAFKLMLGLD